MTKPILKATFITSVHSCARCGFDHKRVVFFPFTNPVVDEDGTVWGWWGNCPATGEPILSKQEEEDENEN